MISRPYALLAELTYRCPLHCPYCSNPTNGRGDELSTPEWERVIGEAAELGVLQAGFSGGEPLVRPRLHQLIREARQAGLYTNLITSGLGFSRDRAKQLREAGLDSVQLSFQSDKAELADAVAGAPAHQRKLAAAEIAREVGLSLSLNFVVHRANIDRLPQMIALAETLNANRVELANVQYYGWAFLNRRHLLPTRQQVEMAAAAAATEKQRLSGRMEILYVLPDYYESRPKPCIQGWGRRYLTVNPAGEVLPCPTATSIPGLVFDSVREYPLQWIWSESETFNRFRGTEWMPEPCRSCPRHEIDFGGCRCQAALTTGDAARTDPVCELSPDRWLIDAACAETLGSVSDIKTWTFRQNPGRTFGAARGSRPS